MTDDELPRPPAFARSSPAGDWIASRYDDVQAILSDDRFGVPEAGPPGPVGTISWLRASVSRFVNGAEHQRRRACAVAELRPLHPHQLRRAAYRRASTVIRQAARPGTRQDGRPGARLDAMALLARRVPMAAMASALGIASAEDAADAVIRIAAGYFPASDPAAQQLADTATAQLVIMLGLDDQGPGLDGQAVRSGGQAAEADGQLVGVRGQGTAFAGPVVGSPGPVAAQPGPVAAQTGRVAAGAGQVAAQAGRVVTAADPASPNGAGPVSLDVIVARIALMVQGCDATAGLIGNALHFLQEAGDQVADWPTSAVLDEVIRRRPVVRASGRIAREPLTTHGHRIRPGDRILCDIDAATTDPATTPSHPATSPNHPTTNLGPSHPATSPTPSHPAVNPSHPGTSLTFGYGVRPCPGRPQALALAAGVIEAVRDECVFLPGQRVEYEPDPPLRVPLRLEVTLP